MPRKKKTVPDKEKTKEQIEQEAAQKAYDKDRAGRRNAASRHVLKLETDMTEDEKRRTFALANDLRIASNRLTGIMEKRVKALIYQDRYKELKTWLICIEDIALFHKFLGTVEITVSQNFFEV